MKVYVVFEDFGPHDGGKHIVGMYAKKESAEIMKNVMFENIDKRDYPEYLVKEFEVSM